MNNSKTHILAQLKKEILPLQGLRSCVHGEAVDVGLGGMASAFPNGQFPLAAVHEFCYNNGEEWAASGGFLSGILSSVLDKHRTALWIGSTVPFTPALVYFGMLPHHHLFIHPKGEKETLWAIEEALQCNSIGAVVSDLKELSFTASRRLQLLVESSGVPLFLLRRQPKNISTSCVTRWQIKPLPSEGEDDLPGIGFPRWQVDLLKVRNGKGGSWVVEWSPVGFRFILPQTAVLTTLQRKTG